MAIIAFAYQQLRTAGEISLFTKRKKSILPRQKFCF